MAPGRTAPAVLVVGRGDVFFRGGGERLADGEPAGAEWWWRSRWSEEVQVGASFSSDCWCCGKRSWGGDGAADDREEEER